jgi:hypothetical protein
MVTDVSDYHLQSQTPLKEYELSDPENEDSTILQNGNFYQSKLSKLEPS